MEKEKANELITKIEEAQKNVEKLNNEAVSFSKSKAELIVTAQTFRDLAEQFSQTLETTENIKNEVSSIGTEKTLKSLSKDSNQFKSSAENMSKEYQNNTEQLIKECKINNEKTIKKVKKTALISCSIMGTISFIISLVALIISLMK